MDPLLLLAVGFLIVVGGITLARLHPFLALVLAAAVVSLLTPAAQIEQALLQQGVTGGAAASRAAEPLGVKLGALFGRSAGQLGLLIALASIVGSALLASGAAERIVRSTLRAFGDSRSIWVFGVCGFVLGIPIFFDTVFLLLLPLARTLAAQTQRRYLLSVLAIAAGATMTHSLVPPTPGPLFAARALGVDLGSMMIGGLLLGAATALVGLLYAHWLDQRHPVPPPPAVAATHSPDDSLPPLWLAVIPITLPVALIGGLTVARTFAPASPVLRFLEQAGEPNAALGLAAVAALALLVRRRGRDRNALRQDLQTALGDAGAILFVTAAGGVFGGVLQETGVGARIAALAQTHQLGVLPLAFAVTALIRVAQGSATVAMVTSVGMLSGVVAAAPLAFHPVYVALAIGCGSKLVPWMNDSGFWVVARTAGLSEAQTFRGFSVMLALMGSAGFILVLLAAWLLPLR